jgi:hypothetical protein
MVIARALYSWLNHGMRIRTSWILALALVSCGTPEDPDAMAGGGTSGAESGAGAAAADGGKSGAASGAGEPAAGAPAAGRSAAGVSGAGTNAGGTSGAGPAGASAGGTSGAGPAGAGAGGEAAAPTTCDLSCAAGERCVLQEVQCIRAPCPPLPACVAAAAVSCDPAKILCKRVQPECPEWQVPSVSGTCYGPCVPVETCACTHEDECPNRDEFVCHKSAGHCGPYV